MELWRLWVLRGPNVWASCPVLEAGVDVGTRQEQSCERSRCVIARVLAWLPSLAEELNPAEELINPPHLLARLTLHLQSLAGNRVSFAQVRHCDQPAHYRIAVEYVEESVGRTCLQSALTLYRAAVNGRPFAIEEEQKRLRQLADDLQLDPNTRALVEAARERNIPVDHFNPADGRYLLLGQGARQRRSLAAETEDISSVARSLTTDKQLTKQLLREAGVPVPSGGGERPISGMWHRLLVVEDRVVAALRIEVPHVFGEGFSRTLDCFDPLKLDSVSDVTEQIHPEVAACAVAAAQALRVRVAGVDVVAKDIGRPLEKQGGAVLEVNTGPGLGLHLPPWTEKARSVGAAILASLFPPGCDGRIPVIALTGGSAQDVGRCLAALLTDAGYRVGRASHDGVFLAGRKINLEDATSYEKARAVLRNCLIDVAVLEASADDLLREGLGCDRCDVAMLTDSAEASENPGWDSEETAEASAALLRALAPNGLAVLNADDPPSCHPLLPPADRILWFAADGDNPRLNDHRAAGGTAVFLSEDSLVLARGFEEHRLPFGGHPGQRETREQLGVLAALAGAMAMNQCGDEKAEKRAPARKKQELVASGVA